MLRRAIPRAQRTRPERLPLFARLLTELAAARLPRRRPRQNPRAVKRKTSNFPLKRPPPADADTLPVRPAPPTIRVLWP